MAETIKMKIDADTAKAESNANDLAKSIDKVGDTAERTNKQLGKIDREAKKTSASVRTLTDDVTENGGAMAILDSLTGGLATTFKDSYEAIELSSKGLKGWRAAALATGIGALVVAIGALVANWDKLSTEIVGATSATRKNLDVLNKLVEQEKERLETLESQENILKLQGLEEDEILLKKQEQTKETIKQIRLQLAEQKKAQAEAVGSSFGTQALFKSTGLGFLGDWLFGKPEEVIEQRKETITETEKLLNTLLNKSAGYTIRLKEIQEERNKLNMPEVPTSEDAEGGFNETVDVEDVSYSEFESDLDALDAKFMAEFEKEEEWRKKTSEADEWWLKKSAEVHAQYQEEETKAEQDALERKEAVAKAKMQIDEAINNSLLAASALLGETTKAGKAFAIAQLLFSQGSALGKALNNSQSPTPDNLASGGLAGIAKFATIASSILTTAAQAKKIIQSAPQIPSVGGGGGGGSFGGGGGSSFSSFGGADTPIIGSIPTFTNTPPPINGSDSEPIRAFVVEDDISTAQNSAKALQRRTIL